MVLARDLLLKGEKDVVLNYFNLCLKFWKSGKKQIDKWTAVVKDGEIPDFGTNLIL